jgi:hypothetical protein
MNRAAFASPLAVVLCALASTTAFAQATAAAPTAPAPATRAKFVTPLKGEALIQVLPGASKYNAKDKEIVTTYKIKNMSSAPIALLKLDEYWYDKGGKMVSTDTQRYKQPFQPGEIIELTMHAPAAGNPAGWNKNVTFTHANGKVTPKKVDKF